LQLIEFIYVFINWSVIIILNALNCNLVIGEGAVIVIRSN